MNTIRILALGGALMVLFFISASFILNRPKEKPKVEMITDSGFAVIELFTSEGCSSCPPADHLIEQLQQQNPNKQLYILSFHVDYWDHQGWKDRFSDKKYTQRQQQYVNWLHAETLYTPQLVVNGVSEHIGSDKAAVLGAISGQLKQEFTRSLKLDAQINGNKLSVTHDQNENGNVNGNSELVLALVQKNAESRVTAGENEGKQLFHVQVVRAFRQVPLSVRTGIEFQLPADFTKAGWELIGYVQDRKTGKISDAARVDW